MGIGDHERPSAKTGTDVWLTPLEIVHSLGKFDLDPCGESYHKTGNVIFTENGLESLWFGRVWLNPPYSQVDLWMDKMIQHNNGVALVFARTETRWAQKALNACSSAFFLSGRIRFLDKDLKPGKYTSGAPSMLLSFGTIPDWDKLGAGIAMIGNKK